MNEEEIVVPETTEEEQDETVTLSKAEYDKLNQTLGSLKKEVKTYKKEVEAPKESNEPDYARLAYLASQKVEHPDDQKLVMEEANRLKMPLTDVLNMEHVKAKLTASQQQRDAENGSPTGSGRKGGAGKGDVDYYLSHPDEVPPNLKLHNEVIDARIKRETENSMFSQVPFVG
jgi:hypothetical protein